ncbi:hypothetical protein NIES2101_35730 [Calothrix sp. HK-06]|nr:hypothetical protein NIES2101_35730 [Calothrix sp. HK-06]
MLVLLTVFFIVEWSIGLWSQSLSLQADAGHMFSDIAALAISLVGSLLAQRPANHKATFGYRRLETLAALANSLGLIFLAGFIIWESIQRWQSPQNIMGLPMLITAVLGLVVNLFNITLLHPHSHNDLNLRGAMLHMISDTVSSVGVILAALAVHLLLAYFIVNGFFGGFFSDEWQKWLWTILIAGWGIATWWILTGGKSWRFLSKFIGVPIWTRGAARYKSFFGFDYERKNRKTKRKRSRSRK